MAPRPGRFLSGFTVKPCGKKCYCQAAASSNAEPKSKRRFSKPKEHVRESVPGRPQQSRRFQPRERADQQDMADLAALKQKKATSASRQAGRLNGLQRAAALQGLDSLPEPFVSAATKLMVRVTKLAACPAHAVYEELLQ